MNSSLITLQLTECAIFYHVEQPTCSSALLAVTEGGRAHRSQPEALSSLQPRCIAGLVGMPQLLAVVTELCAAALPAAGDLWTAGAPEGYDCISGKKKT